MRVRLLVCAAAVAALCVCCGSSGGGPSGSSEAGAADAASQDAGMVDAADAVANGDDAMADDGSVDAPLADQGTQPDQGAPTGILCPGATPPTCPAGDMCCVSGNPEAGPQQGSCESAEAGTCSGTPVTCSQTSDCTMGLACCGLLGTKGGNVAYQWVRCVSPIVWGCDDVNTVRFCDPVANDCPASEANCVASQLLVGFHTCHP
jgi:hypothetical protein